MIATLQKYIKDKYNSKEQITIQSYQLEGINIKVICERKELRIDIMDYILFYFSENVSN